jgi:general secretion pathway protein M
MTIVNRIENVLVRHPRAAALLYLALIIAFVLTTIETSLDLVARRDAAIAISSLLEQIEARTSRRSPSAAPTDISAPAGSPFIEGTTMSVAGATLLQRVAAAIARVRGNVLSSQVDLQGSQSKAGFITVTASLEVDAASLQSLLYDLEAGMPFLFIDQMVVQAPTGASGAAGGKLRVLLSVSGQWRGAK